MNRKEGILDTMAICNSRTVPTLLVIAFSACVAHAQPNYFVENFEGPGLDPAWTQGGDPAGHPVLISGTYDITDAHGQPGTKLFRSTGGTVSSFTHEIDVVLDPHLFMGSGGSLSDFKFSSIGTDGVLDVVYNSFGHLRVNHTDFQTGSSDHIAGGSPDNISIGYSDGDALRLTVVYHDAVDTIDVSYSLNGEASVSVYSGSGIDGRFGDVITSTTEASVFKFGDGVPNQSLVAIDQWRLAANSNGIPGDFDFDEDVDGFDFLIWQRGDSPLGGTQDELGDWVANYGSQSSLAATAAVPEPCGLLLLLVSTACLGLCHRMTRKN